MKLDLFTLPAAGPAALHQHRGLDWRPTPLLPEGDEHDDGGDDGEGEDGDDGDDAEGGDDGKGKGGDEELTAEQWREKFEAQQRVNRSLERKTRRDKAALDRLNAAQAAAGKGKGDDDKVDVEKLREEVRTEAQREVLRERVLDKIEAKAGSRFAIDPEDVAVMLLRRAEGGVDDFVADGKVDTAAITDALDELLNSNKSLAAQGGGQRFRGGADQGPRGDGKEKPLDQQIAEAMKAGDVKLALHLQNQKLVKQ
jgi:hypothetical protein